MNKTQQCRVVGLEDNGEVIVITDYISHEKAVQIVALIGEYSTFARLRIECEDEQTR